MTLKDMALANDSKDNVTCLIIHAVAQHDPRTRSRAALIVSAGIPECLAAPCGWRRV